MKINDFVSYEGCIYRVLAINDEQILVINCTQNEMPKYLTADLFSEAKEYQLPNIPKLDELSLERRSKAYRRYSVIAAAVAVVGDVKKRNAMINQASAIRNEAEENLKA